MTTPLPSNGSPTGPAHTPSLLYGTAWKEERTQALVELALAQGFRGIDTANQRRHYHEAAVGQAIAAAIAKGLVTRDQLFLQSKYTFQRGQDHRLPYDPAAPIAKQVEQSLASTLAHLGTDRLDAYLLHGPSRGAGLAAEDWEAWGAMENLARSGRVAAIGVSNFSQDQLRLLCERATIPPAFVQNRCYASRGWDRSVRELCAAAGIRYQGFSLLTANRGVLANPELLEIASRYGRTVPQVIFRFAIDVGMLPLTGTSSPLHMQQDLAVSQFRLDPAETARIEGIAAI